MVLFHLMIPAIEFSKNKSFDIILIIEAENRLKSFLIRSTFTPVSFSFDSPAW